MEESSVTAATTTGFLATAFYLLQLERPALPWPLTTVITTLAANGVFAGDSVLPANEAFAQRKWLRWAQRPPHSPPLPPPDPHAIGSIDTSHQSPPLQSLHIQCIRWTPRSRRSQRNTTTEISSERADTLREGGSRGATEGGKQRHYGSGDERR